MSEAVIRTTQPAGDKPGNFIGRHWRGDYSLARSYWLHTVLLSSLLPAFSISLLARLTNDMPARYGVAGVLAIAAFSYLAWIWGVRGCWMSASRHVARGGRRWAEVAVKVLIVFGAISLVSSTWRASHSFREQFDIARGKQLGPPVVYQLRVDGKSVLLQGGMNDGAADGLERLLQAHPSVTTVVLYSAGGWVREGRLVGDVIRRRGLNTYVEQECSSSCTLAFMAGRDRAMDPRAHIGFHTLYTVGGDDRINKTFDRNLTFDTYGKLGLPRDFIARIADTPSNKSWYPEQGQMLQAGVLTRLAPGGETAQLATMATSRDVLEEEFKKGALFDIMARYHPKDFAHMVDLAWALAQAHASDAEILAVGREQVGILSRKLLPIASDESLQQFQQLVLDQAVALRGISAAACTELIYPRSRADAAAGRETPQAVLPQEFANREMAMTQRLLRDADPANAVRFTLGERTRVIRRALAPLSQEQLRLLSSPERRQADPDATCDASISYLRAVNELPAEERKIALRVLYSRVD
ncbi:MULTISPECIES: hypothetical protein [unclassified Herbaspirillum]|uniref:COG3904 family protein n=1 Tax=unclassified Herbaspirillum TaxID=2624150 RepID=UPI00114F8582|nr:MULTISPECIES: hypothetical protein [unclassified Herbaspirillum]MBB5392713.1 hypothetical protein [Herbaspirillum sp. SJZ102]TQJ99114.1 hypothetical protein FB599_4112 [Herbaspirillum sp. SJZ130]TQK04127.1 hypothetical protein FB598_4054 [Herbaspirillum sp. SJZ106]